MPRFLPLLALVIALPLAAAVQPEVSLTDPTLDRAVGYPLIASNGNGYLAAWSSLFGGTTFVYRPDAVTGAGLAALPVAVDDPSRDFKSLCDMTSDGTDYLLLTAANSKFTAIVVDQQTRVVATHVVAQTGNFATTARAAWNGEKYLIAFVPDAFSGRIVGQFLDRSGEAVGDAFTIATRSAPQISLASNGRDFLIAGTSYDNCKDNACAKQLFTIAVDASGKSGALQPIAPAVEPYLYAHSLRYTGRHYVLAWNDSLGDFHSVNEVPLDASGLPERPATIIATGDKSTGTIALNVAATGNGAAVFIQQRDSIQAVRVDIDGNPVDSHPVDVIRGSFASDRVVPFDAAWSEGRFFAVWSHLETDASQTVVPFVYGSEIDFSSAQTGSSIARAAVPDVILDVASAGRMQLVLSVEHPPTQRSNAVTARRLVDGVPSGAPFVLIEPQLNEPATSIATNGSDFLVVSSEFEQAGGNMIRARLLRNGAAPSSALTLGTGSDAPFAVWTGQQYLVFWTVREYLQDSGPQQHSLFVRVSAAGELLDAQPRAIPDAGNIQVVNTPTGLVAIYLIGTPAFFRAFRTLAFDVYATRMSGDGEFIADRVQITQTSDSENSVHVATEPGGNVFVTWIENPLDYHFQSHAFAAVLKSDLTVLQRIDLATLSQPRDVAWSGHAFVLAWVGDQVYEQPYSKSGDALAPPTALTDDASAKGQPQIVSVPGGVFIAYTRPSPATSGSDAQRAVGRMIYDATDRRRAVTPH